MVRGVNVVRRHQKQSATAEGGIVTKELPIHMSNISLMDGSGKATRVGFRMAADGVSKVRFSRRTGDVIDG